MHAVKKQVLVWVRDRHAGTNARDRIVDGGRVAGIRQPERSWIALHLLEQSVDIELLDRDTRKTVVQVVYRGGQVGVEPDRSCVEWPFVSGSFEEWRLSQRWQVEDQKLSSTRGIQVRNALSQTGSGDTWIGFAEEEVVSSCPDRVEAGRRCHIPVVAQVGRDLLFHVRHRIVRRRGSAGDRVRR